MIQDVSQDVEAQIQLINASKNYLAMLFFMVVYYILLTYFAFNSAAHKLSYSCYWILNSIKKEIEKCIRTNTAITPDRYKKWFGEYLISSLYDNLAVDFFGIFSFPKSIFSMTNTEIEGNCMLLTEYIQGEKDELFYY